ncbi:MAG: sigma 54-interacting transcriptional regulator, partial [Eubacterium sp.]
EQGDLKTVVCTYREISDYLNLMSVVNKQKIENKQKMLLNNDTQFTFEEIRGNSTVLKETLERAKQIAKTDEAVLIYGETGTGKELFAQSIHNASSRRNGRFVAVNCSAIPETLLESTLFGTCKGSFTGAVEKKGLFEEAEGSTLFLDEINSMDITFQSKLLRAVETKRFRKLGGNREISCDIRFISAMNQSPEEAIQEKALRLDLYYRLAVFKLEIAPLRKRGEDIKMLAAIFLEQFAPLSGKRVAKISEEALDLLKSRRWPGNIRELKHVVRQSIYNARDDELSLIPEHLEDSFIGGVKKEKDETEMYEIEDTSEKSDFHGAIERYEKQLLIKALEANAYNISKTARMLKLPRQTLHVKINKYGLHKK